MTETRVDEVVAATVARINVLVDRANKSSNAAEKLSLLAEIQHRQRDMTVNFAIASLAACAETIYPKLMMLGVPSAAHLLLIAVDTVLAAVPHSEGDTNAFLEAITGDRNDAIRSTNKG